MSMVPDQIKSSEETSRVSPPPRLVDQACELAAELLEKAHAQRTQEERKEAAKISAMLEDTKGKELTFHLADQVFRPPTPKQQAAVFRRLLETYGIPSYLPWHQRLLMKIGALASRLTPGIVMPAVTAQIRRDSQRVILPREDDKLLKYQNSRERVNVNLLGD